MLAAWKTDGARTREGNTQAGRGQFCRCSCSLEVVGTSFVAVAFYSGDCAMTGLGALGGELSSQSTLQTARGKDFIPGSKH